jgi:rSAM/selenodomain-associated transferase 1
MLSVADTTELYRCFLRDTIAITEQVPDIDVFVSFTPEGTENLFDRISNGHRLIPQRGLRFGDKLYNALDDLLRDGYESAAIMDSDSPTLPAAYLTRAFEELARPGDRVVLGPTTDGGYYIIGIKRPHRALFEGIAWSTERVLKQTMDRARELDLEVALLPEWYDIDTIPDLERLCGEIRNGSSASNTRDFILARWPEGKLSARR